MSKDYKDLQEFLAVSQNGGGSATLVKSSWLRADRFFHPGFNRGPQFVQATGEEMVCSFDHHELLRFGRGRNHRCQLVPRAELVAGSADEQLRLNAFLQKFERVGARHFALGNYRTNRRANANHRLNAVVGARGPQSNCGTEGESRKHQGQVVFPVKPVQRGADIADFAIALIVLALA